jgi:SAM-dependent methyltransferase
MAGKYDRRFFDSIMAGSQRSAEIMFDHLEPLFAFVPRSLVDVGCGSGTWCRVFGERFGSDDILGIDGDYVDRAQLRISPAHFLAHDLTRSLPARRRFGLAMSLEVGEHLPPESGPELVRTLVGHADHVLFSAAVPGQGGEFHINERPLDYWRGLFAAHDYIAVDCLRPSLHRNRQVEPWYRFNTLLYVRAARIADLPESFAGHVVPHGQPLGNFASPLWRMRCGVVGLMPPRIVLALARAKRRVVSPALARLASP